jgi:putative copper export protein
MDDLAVARALHVLAVAHWIGGVAFVTLVVLPLARLKSSMQLFDHVERRFAAQVRVSVPLAGATGLWMAWRLDLWDRFVDWHTWWVPAMLGLWLAFMLIGGLGLRLRRLRHALWPAPGAAAAAIGQRSSQMSSKRQPLYTLLTIRL